MNSKSNQFLLNVVLDEFGAIVHIEFFHEAGFVRSMDKTEHRQNKHRKYRVAVPECRQCRISAVKQEYQFFGAEILLGRTAPSSARQCRRQT
jgi:hypothetical protein